MRRLLLALLASAPVLLAQDPQDPPRPDPEGASRPLADRDADGDGRLSPEEAGLPERAFAALDRNADGFLDAEELKQARRLRERAEGERGRRGEGLREALQRLDRNGDGLLQKDELPDRFPLGFEEADRNGDGALDPEELHAAFERMGPGRDGRPGRGGPPWDRADPEQLQRMAQAILGRLDKDGDNRLSAEELPADGRLDLAESDKNGDGFLDRFELAIALQSARGQGGPGFDPRRLRQALEEMDADGDGRITREEWKGREEIFRRLDADGDGIVTREEIRQAIGRLEGWAGRSGDALFRRADKDGDGRVSREEWPLSPEAFDRFDRNGDGFISREEVTPRGPRAGRMAPDEQSGRDSTRFLGRWDANGDGKVSREEFPHERRFAEMDANSDGVLDASEIEEACDKRLAESGYGFLERFDLDQDGRVTRDEFTGPMRVFERLDRNHDGVIDESDRPDRDR